MENNTQESNQDLETRAQANSSPETVSDGTLGFILSLVGLVFFQLLCIVSFFIAKKEKDQAAELGVEPAGLTKAAYIISIIGMILIIAMVVGVVFLLFLITAVGVNLGGSPTS